MTAQKFITAFGIDVRRMRALAGWSQDDLARASCTSQGTVSRLERGEADVHFRCVLGISGALATVVPDFETAAPPPMRALLALTEQLDAPIRIAEDPGLASLLRTYQALTPQRRATFLRLVVPIAALVTETQLRETPL